MPLGVGLVVIALFLVIGLPGAIIENIIENQWGILQIVLIIGGIIHVYVACYYLTDYFAEKDDIFSTIMFWICTLVVFSPALFILWLIIDFIQWL